MEVKSLWRVIHDKFPGEFSGDYPDTDEVRAAVLKKFPTKQQLEEEWAEKNSVIF